MSWLVYPLVVLSADETLHISWFTALICLVIGFFLLHGIIAIHELGHTLAGHVVGIRISSFLVGAGRKLVEFRLGETVVTWKLFPKCGLVRPVQSQYLFSTYQYVPFILGGIVAEVLLAAALWEVYQSPTWHDQIWLNPIGRYTLLAAGFFLLATIFFSVRPSMITIEGPTSPNDALLLLNLWKGRQLFRDFRYHGELIVKGNIAAAEEISKNFILRNSNNPSILITGAQIFELQGCLDKARQSLEQVLLSIPKDAALRTQVFDYLACLVLNHGRSDWLQDADKWSTSAWEADPKSVTLRGTRGSVLAELGRNAEARTALLDVLMETESDQDRAYCFIYLAWLDAQDGNHALAAEKLQKSKSFNLPIKAIARLEKIILDLRNKIPS
ncbi:MAG TPA: site-2 protease family protein [Opitutaceae bacterium]|nr:site-2 protease family protein [Opitutaceae bacterium]